MSFFFKGVGSEIGKTWYWWVADKGADLEIQHQSMFLESEEKEEEETKSWQRNPQLIVTVSIIVWKVQRAIFNISVILPNKLSCELMLMFV